MTPALFAFDLDGTLLDSGKRVRPANAAALRAISGAGAVAALASGRLGAGVRRYAAELGIDPAPVTLNGAEVFTDSGEDAPLGLPYAEYLTGYSTGKPFAANFYAELRKYSNST